MKDPHGMGTNGEAAGPPARPKTILLLGGGGMKGMAHVGVLRALQRLGIVVDEIIGTSIGSVIGGFAASGMPVEELTQMAGELTRKSYFRLNLLKFLVKGYRHASLYRGRNFHDFLKSRLKANHSFSDLQVPFFCNALSLTTGAPRYFGLPGLDRIPLADAIYASSCLPGIFEPLELDGDHFIDGGIADTLPLRLARIRKPDLILAVDLSIREYGRSKPYKASLPHILFRAFEIAEDALNEQNLHMNSGPDVVLIKPKVGHLGIFEFENLDDTIQLGEREALEVLTTHPLTRGLCHAAGLSASDRIARRPRNYVGLDVDLNRCIHCGICAVTCATEGYGAVPFGDVVQKVHNYECTKDGACQRNCPTGAIRLIGL